MKAKLARVFVMAKSLEMVGEAWFFATYGLFLVSIGLNEWEFVGVNMIFMSVKALLDPITGNIGDRYGQKKVYLVGILFWSIGLFTYGFAKEYWGCALAEGLSAIGAALISEALESWLKNISDDDTVLKAQSGANFYGKLATIPTAILGGVVGAKWGLEWPWFFGGVSALLVAIIVWWLLKEYGDKARDHKVSGIDLSLWMITKKAMCDRRTRKIFGLVAIVAGCMMPFNMYWQRIFVEAKISPEWMGSFWIGMAMLTATGGWIAGRLKPLSKTLVVILLSIGLPMLWPMYLLSKPWWMVTAFFSHEIGRGAFNPILWTYFNKKIENVTRTSTNSLRSAAGSMGAVAGLIIMATLTGYFSLTQIWAISALVLIITALWVKTWNHD